MIFSVFDHNARCFDYYEAPGTAADFGARGTKYRPLTQGPQGPAAKDLGLAGARPGERVVVGFSPEALAMPLPANARFVGRGDEARGVIAVVRRSQGVHMQAGYDAIDGLGSSPPENAIVCATTPTPFTRVVAAACIAAVVGVLVQRALK